MKALANETFIPQVTVGEGKKAKLVDEEGCAGYEIKALTSMEFCELISDGSHELRLGVQFKHADIKRALRLGLVNPDLMNTMSAIHLAKTAKAIYDKANLAEDERKNS